MRFDNPEQKRTFMLTTPVSRLIPKMALPSMAGMLVTSAYNLADTFFVSQLGTYATGAVGVNGAIDNILMMAGALLATGASSYTSRLLGAKKDRQAHQVLSTSFFTAFLLGALVFMFGNLYEDRLLLLLGANETILPYSRQYCQYILLAAPFVSTSFVLNQCLRAEGSAAYSMWGMCVGAILNIGLDPLFIFVFGWGVAGASAATALSKLVSWCILMLPYVRGKTLLRLRPGYIRFRWKDIREVCTVGSSSFFRSGLATLAAIVLNRLAVGYGESALAAISVSNRITFFMVAACLGFGQGLQPVAGFSWGAARYDRVLGAYTFSKRVCVIGISVFAALMALFARPILLLFTQDDAELVRIGVFALRMQCLAMPFHGYCIVTNMLCASIGRPLPTFLLGISRNGICFFPVLPLLNALAGVWGIASVQAAADILSTALALPIDIRITRDLKKRLQEAI